MTGVQTCALPICEAYILKEIKTQDEEVFYEMVDDDTEFAALAKIFAELADEETQLLY